MHEQIIHLHLFSAAAVFWQVGDHTGPLIEPVITVPQPDLLDFMLEWNISVFTKNDAPTIKNGYRSFFLIILRKKINIVHIKI